MGPVPGPGLSLHASFPSVGRLTSSFGRSARRHTFAKPSQPKAKTLSFFLILKTRRK